MVYPAAGLIDYYRGNKLVLINKSVTSRDSQADLVISDSIGKVLGTVWNDNGSGRSKEKSEHIARRTFQTT